MQNCLRLQGAVVGLSNFMTRYWYIILIGIFAIVMGLRAYGSTESGDYVYSNLVLRIPLVGKLKKKDSLRPVFKEPEYAAQCRRANYRSPGNYGKHDG